ncbi:hypothetical protein [Flavobacterium quisquiliarum]|uniref:DUF4168 domain-containing protein n=1 Tax=Flavobacterium quisquiliarum TaxID=1834436 RepID=A0ABV8WAK3_9FLAO|nr:hypothetical protein [Flavobacterium quisquiliarum]MBW1654782.1 hypothetical protein [Flavobacterium quisquiliarum]NWL00203.1 hypothetical protein [Flavobacterium collinsii]
MKLTQNLIIFVFTLFCFNSVSAQYGNGYYNNGYGNGYGRGGGMGMDRSMMAGQGQGSQSKPKEIPVEETASKITEQMKPELKLDDLQAIAITNVLADSLREQGILLKNESSNQDLKIEQMKALRETTDKKIISFLNPDQVEPYKTFMEKLKEGKTGKTKKKKNKDSKDSKEVKENADTKIEE